MQPLELPLPTSPQPSLMMGSNTGNGQLPGLGPVTGPTVRPAASVIPCPTPPPLDRPLKHSDVGLVDRVGRRPRDAPIDRHRDRHQDADDYHDHHQFDQGEPLGSPRLRTTSPLPVPYIGTHYTSLVVCSRIEILDLRHTN